MAALDPEVRAFLNDAFQEDIVLGVQNKLTEAEIRADELTNLLRQLEAVNSEAAKAAADTYADCKAQLQQVGTRGEQIDQQCDDRLKDSSALSLTLNPLMAKLRTLENTHAYIQNLAFISATATAVNESMAAGDADTAVNKYTALLTYYRSLRGSTCETLRTIAYTHVKSLYDTLTKQLAKSYTDALEDMQWPTPPSKLSTQPTNYEEGRALFERLFGLMLDLKSPYEDEDEEALDHTSTSVMTRTDRVLSMPPIALLVKPIELRFGYHFSGRRETNRIDKPEWMFTYALNVLRDHQELFRDVVQPQLDARGIGANAMVTFAYGLTQMLNRKLEREMFRYVLSRAFLSHVISEAINFENELRDEFNYPRDLPGCVHIFTDVHERFAKWLQFETDFAMEQFNEILDSNSALSLKYNDVADVDTLHPTEAAADIASLLQSVTERFTGLSNTHHQYAFVKNIQLRILSDFLAEVEETVREKYDDMSELEHQKQFIMMLNSINYLRTVLSDWSDQVLFVEMYHALHAEERKTDADGWRDADGDGDEEASIGGVFDEILRQYANQCEWMVTRLVSGAADAIKPLLEDYRTKERWILSAAAQQLKVVESVTPSLCDALVRIQDTLTNMCDNLATPLFAQVWPMFASALSKHIVSEVVLHNNFNSTGARQFDFDMSTLVKMFSQYTSKPDNFLKELKDARLLLLLSGEKRADLKGKLVPAVSEPDESTLLAAKAALESNGVYRLSPDQALEVLNRTIER